MSDAPASPPALTPEPPALTPGPSWDPPPTLAARLSPHLRRFFKLSGALAVSLLLLAQVLWAIPTWLVSRRPGFQALRQSVEGDRGYQQALWGKVEAASWPDSYAFPDKGPERYTLLVSGPAGEIRVEAHVLEGKVVHRQSLGVADWRSAWNTRKNRQR